MKRITALLLFLILVYSCICPVNVYAVDGFYTIEGENLNDYLKTSWPELLQQDSNYEYVEFVNNINDCWLSKYLLNMANFFAQTGVTPGEEKYKEVLLNIIETHNFNNSGDIALQKKMDNLKTFEDYGKDTVKICAQAVSVMSGMGSTTSQLEENISMAIDGLSVLIDTTENWIGALSDLETVVQSYSYYSDFLELIESNSTGELKKAAESLKSTLTLSMKIRLETYTDVTKENFERWGEEYFSDVLFEACKTTKEYKTDDNVKWFVDFGYDLSEKLDGLIDSWELGENIGKLMGNLIAGGENLANRLQETMAIKDIGGVLSDYLHDKAIQEFSEVIGTEKEIDFVQKYVTISKFLVDCRIRGEYCLYSIVANDAGLLSSYNKETGKNAEDMYNGLVGVMEDVSNELDKVNRSLRINEIDTNVYYEFSNGEILSQLYFETVDGKKMANLFFWHNYGASASDEDFVFLWNDNKSLYKLQGNRSKKFFNVCFRYENEQIIKIDIICQEEYYNWITGEKDNIFLSADYQKVNSMKLSEICKKVVEHYNTQYNTDEFEVFYEECEKTEEGYMLVLRTKKGNVANKYVCEVNINIESREVKDELGNVWSL